MSTATPPNGLHGDFKASFGRDGIQLKAEFTGVGKSLADLAPKELGVLDTTKIKGAVELLNTTDFESIGKAVEAALGDADDLFEHLPDPEDLLTDFANVLTRLVTGVEADIGRTLKQLEDGARRLVERLSAEALTAADIDVSVAAARLAQFFDVVARVSGSPLLALVLASFSSVADRFVGGWNTLAAQGLGAVSLTRSLGSLGGIDALSRQLLALALLLERPFETGRMEAALARLSLATADADLLARLKNVDVTNPFAVDLATAPVLAFAADVEQFAELLDSAVRGSLEAIERAGLPALIAGIEAHSVKLVGAGVAGVGELAKALRTVTDPILRFQPPALKAGEAAHVYLANRLAQAAREVSKLQVDVRTKPLVDGLQSALGPVHEIRIAAERVAAAIETAIRAFVKAAESVDLGAVAETARRALAPIGSVLAEVRAAVEVLKGTLQKTADSVVAAIGQIRAEIEALFKTIHAAFAKVDDVVSQAKLEELVGALRAAIETVATFLRSAPLAPVIDTVIGILNTAADLLSAVPKDILPAAVRDELEAAAGEIEAIDFKGVTQDLVKQLRDVTDDIIGNDVLKPLDDAHAAVVGFLEDIDPRKVVSEFEAGPFQDVVDEIEKFDPAAALAPVQAVLDEVSEAIEDFKPKELLAPIDAAFDTIVTQFAKLDPAVLLKSIENGADELRKEIQDAVPIAGAVAAIERVDTWVTKNIGSIKPDEVLEVLDAIYDGFADAIRELACETGQLAGSVRGLLRGIDLDIPLASLGESLKQIVAGKAAATVAERIELLAGALSSATASVDRLNLDVMVADLARTHKAIAEAVRGTVMAPTLDPVLARSDPATLFAGLAGDRARLRTASGAATATLGRVHGSEWSELTAKAEALRAELAPLAALPAKLREILQWLGADPGEDGLVKAVDDLLARFRPSTFMKPLVEALVEVGADVAKVVHGLLAPVITALRDVEGLIKLIDAPLPPELYKLHGDLSKELKELAPSAILGDTIAAIEGAKTSLVTFRPLASVEVVLEAARKDAAALVTEARPTVVFAPAFEIYDRVVATIADLDVRKLLAPLIDAVDDLERQIADGMIDASVALDRLKDSARSPGGLKVAVEVLS